MALGVSCVKCHLIFRSPRTFYLFSILLDARCGHGVHLGCLEAFQRHKSTQDAVDDEDVQIHDRRCPQCSGGLPAVHPIQHSNRRHAPTTPQSTAHWMLENYGETTSSQTRHLDTVCYFRDAHDTIEVSSASSMPNKREQSTNYRSSQQPPVRCLCTLHPCWSLYETG